MEKQPRYFFSVIFFQAVTRFRLIFFTENVGLVTFTLHLSLHHPKKGTNAELPGEIWIDHLLEADSAFKQWFS